MNKDDKKSTVDLVNWIHKNRKAIDELTEESDAIRSQISDLSDNNIDSLDKIKTLMGSKKTVNVKIIDKYYTLTQKVVGIEIAELIIDIDINVK